MYLLLYSILRIQFVLFFSFFLVLSVLFAEAKVFHTKVGHSITIECGVDTYSSSVKWDREGQIIHSIMQRGGMPVKGTVVSKPDTLFVLLLFINLLIN